VGEGKVIALTLGKSNQPAYPPELQSILFDNVFSTRPKKRSTLGHVARHPMRPGIAANQEEYRRVCCLTQPPSCYLAGSREDPRQQSLQADFPL
jgi:hypothetical protein